VGHLDACLEVVLLDAYLEVDLLGRHLVLAILLDDLGSSD